MQFKFPTVAGSILSPYQGYHEWVLYDLEIKIVPPHVQTVSTSLMSKLVNVIYYFVSICYLVHKFYFYIFKYSWLLYPFCRSLHQMAFLGREHWRLMFGTPVNPFYHHQTEKSLKQNFDEAQMKKSYRKHLTYVKSRVKAQNLLVYNVKDGWGPLCNFLGISEPKMPFPKEKWNKRRKSTKISESEEA